MVIDTGDMAGLYTLSLMASSSLLEAPVVQSVTLDTHVPQLTIYGCNQLTSYLHTTHIHEHVGEMDGVITVYSYTSTCGKG
jgi:hypothetical protein